MGYKQGNLTFYEWWLLENKTGKYGVASQCKSCHKRIQKEKYDLNPQYYIDRSEKWRKANLEKSSKAAKKRYSKWKSKNLKKYNHYQNQYSINRKKTDINFKLRSNLRNRLYQALKGNFKNGSAVRDLGCSVEELKLYLEKQFKDAMTWHNYGKWDIDHIKPLFKFDLTNPEEFKKACHFSNLQPLWKADHIIKTLKDTNNNQLTTL